MANWSTRVNGKYGTNIDIRFINLSEFEKQLKKELTPRSSVIEIGVEEKPYINKKGQQEVRGWRAAKKGLAVPRVVTTSIIGAGHEFGNSWQPRRSFLELSVKHFIKEGSFKEITERAYKYTGAFLRKVSEKLYQTIIECFLTSGWGTWKPLSKSYKQKTGRENPPLIDTGQLMSAVYTQYEGFTVKGSHIAPTRMSISSSFGEGYKELFKREDKKTREKEERLQLLKQSSKRLEEKLQSLVRVAEEKKIKKKEETKDELIQRLYDREKKKGEVHYLQFLGEVGFDLDNMTKEQIKERYGL